VIGVVVGEMTSVEGGVQYWWEGIFGVKGGCIARSDSEGVLVIGVWRWKANGVWRRFWVV